MADIFKGVKKLYCLKKKKASGSGLQAAGRNYCESISRSSGGTNLQLKVNNSGVSRRILFYLVSRLLISGFPA
jgi:hypothetical protein